MRLTLASDKKTIKLEIELPDWIDDHAMYIFSGMNLVAYRNKDGKWNVKTSRCNWCGKCCMKLGDKHIFPTIDGQCIHLKKEAGDNDQWLCGLSLSRPFSCSAGVPNKQEHPYCTELYEVRD